MQKAFQVVGVLALARAAHRAGREQLWGPAEGLGGGERLVEAGVLDPTPADDAGVDGIGEDLGQALPGDRLDGAVAPSPVGEALVAELAGQALEGPVSAGVVLEGDRDERGALGIRDDASHLAAGDDSHAQSPIESGSTTDGGGVPFTCEDVTPEGVRSGVAGETSPERTPQRTG